MKIELLRSPWRLKIWWKGKPKPEKKKSTIRSSFDKTTDKDLIDTSWRKYEQRVRKNETNIY